MQIVINTPGTYLTQHQGCFRIKQQEQHWDISPLKVEAIVIVNKAMLSTQAIVLALEHKVDVVFLDGTGEPVGRVWFSRMGSTARIRRRQLEFFEAPQGLAAIKDILKAKVGNQAAFLKKLCHARPGREELFKAPIEILSRCLASFGEVLSPLNEARGTLMGIEGVAGRAFFGCLGQIMPQRYKFSGRSRRPAKDPFNAALNYSYGMLYSEVEKACILAGLDPFVGLLHTDDYNKKSLVMDLIEPFRIYAEEVCAYLFTGRKMQDSHFDFEDDAVSLNTSGKPVLVDALNRHMEQGVRFRRRIVKRRHIIRHSAHRLANSLLEGDGDALPKWLDIKEF